MKEHPCAGTAGIAFFFCIALFLLTAGCVQHCGEGEEPCGFSCYNRSMGSCCRDKVYQGSGWWDCQGICYNWSEWTCCPDGLHRGTGWESCGDLCYQIKNQSCCNGSIYEGLNWGECDGVCYNRKTSSCSNLTVVTRPVEEDMIDQNNWPSGMNQDLLESVYDMTKTRYPDEEPESTLSPSDEAYCSVRCGLLPWTENGKTYWASDPGLCPPKRCKEYYHHP